MHRTLTLRLPIAVSSLLAVLSCSKPDEPLSPSFTTGTCSLGFTFIGSKNLSVSPNSKNNYAGWFIENTGNVNATITGQTGTKSGSVTAVRTTTWATLPYTLSPGSRIDADVQYDVGGSGSGTVGLTIATSCGSKVLPVHLIFIQSPAPLGIPYGVASLFTNTSTTETVGTESFNLSMDGVTASTIIGRITAARSKNLKLLTNMTGGPHSEENPGRFLTRGSDGILRFDMAKWRDAMDDYSRTAGVVEAVRQAVADGVIIGNSVMDEPNVTGQGDGNTWGPPGTMTKLRVDDMCAYVKNIFPTLPVGVAHNHDVFEPAKSYTVCDFIVSQYSARHGDVTAFRDGGLALAARDHHAIAFSINVLNGGVQDRDGTWDCAGTGGLGQRSPNCAMTAAQVRAWGQLLGQAGCAMNMWRYDLDFMANSANQQAFADVRNLLNSKPSKACRRS